MARLPAPEHEDLPAVTSTMPRFHPARAATAGTRSGKSDGLRRRFEIRCSGHYAYDTSPCFRGSTAQRNGRALTTLSYLIRSDRGKKPSFLSRLLDWIPYKLSATTSRATKTSAFTFHRLHYAFRGPHWLPTANRSILTQLFVCKCPRTSV